MIRSLTVAALLVAAVPQLAAAQGASPAGEERGPHAARMAEQREGRFERRQRERAERREERREAREERRERRMHRGNQTGFEIEIWPGRSLEVRCGEEPVADCAESMRPVLEALIAAPPPPAPGAPPHRVPPRPGGPGAGSADARGVDVPLPPGTTGTPPAPPAGLSETGSGSAGEPERLGAAPETSADGEAAVDVPLPPGAATGELPPPPEALDGDAAGDGPATTNDRPAN